MKNVVHIFGASGSGTTTLARALCEKLNFFHMDSDDYFWVPTDPPFTLKRPAEERVLLMQEDIYRHEHVVVSGSLCDWGDALIPFFTLAVRIEINQALRMERLQKREFQRFGSRIENGSDMYEQHMKFMQWAKQYDTGGMEMRSKVKHDAWQKMLGCQVCVVNGGDTLERNIARIMEYLA